MLDFLHYRKYSDSTLMRMTKKELIEQIHCLLHNWRNCAERGENTEKLLKEEMDKNTWISVNDRLPNEHGGESLYLVCVKGTEYPFRAFWDGQNWGDGISEIDVKYWMPLPGLPKGV